MADNTTGMTYKEKSAFASDSLPDPRFTNEEATETPIIAKRAKKRSSKTKKIIRKKKSTLKSRKVR